MSIITEKHGYLLHSIFRYDEQIAFLCRQGHYAGQKENRDLNIISFEIGFLESGFISLVIIRSNIFDIVPNIEKYFMLNIRYMLLEVGIEQRDSWKYGIILDLILVV
jgi:hypothetical protein